MAIPGAKQNQLQLLWKFERVVIVAISQRGISEEIASKQYRYEARSKNWKPLAIA